MKKFLVIVISLVFVASCSSKGKVKEESLSPTAIKGYGITGSDAGQAGQLKTVNFDFDKFALTSAAKTILKQNAAWLKKNTDVKVQIEGHCDSRGTIEYNVALGEKRANTVQKYLTAIGVAAGRMSTISYGKERPLCGEDTEECWAKNRRANFVLINN
jgi:peptidoglycan-associated lipoprotein